MRAFFDVNMLLAMFDPGHMFHRTAMAWWAVNKSDGWASSPLTQNGYVRVISRKSYQRPVSLPDALRSLRLQIAAPGHEFWADDVSLLDSHSFDHARLLSARQITDVYLLSLAVKHGGHLVTFDRGIPLMAASGARPEHLVVL